MNIRDYLPWNLIRENKRLQGEVDNLRPMLKFKRGDLSLTRVSMKLQDRNIEIRKENEDLRIEVMILQGQNETYKDTISDMERIIDRQNKEIDRLSRLMKGAKDGD